VAVTKLNGFESIGTVRTHKWGLAFVKQLCTVRAHSDYHYTFYVV